MRTPDYEYLIRAALFVLLWDPGHQRGTGNTHNYHVNEGAAVCRGQLTQRWTDPPEVSLGCLGHAGLGERGRGRGGSLLDPISHQNTLWWIHANSMGTEACLASAVLAQVQTNV